MKLAVFGVFFLCLAGTVWVVSGYVAASQVPDIPVYPDARNVQKAIDKDSFETPNGPLVGLITFETSATPEEVLIYYGTTLEKDGWKNDWCCKNLYRYKRYNPQSLWGYYVWVNVEGKEKDQTKVRIEMQEGTVVCDCMGN